MPDSERNLRTTNSSDLSQESQQNSQECFAIAAIGASAGGLQAFTQLLRNLPDDIGMGFVLIQHLAPDHDSRLSEILQKTTRMPVNQAQEGMRIVPNNVYVIPPNTLMTLDQGLLKCEPRRQVRGKYMAIDGFFSSLAADRGSQSIAIVLSGSNEDGTAGLGAIKSVGGITFAQDLESAEFQTMPMIAIASGYVDFVLSPAEIAAELVNISQGNRESDFELNIKENEEFDDSSAPAFTENSEALSKIFALLHNAMGIDFSNYKKGTIERRIARRMGLISLKNMEVYSTYLQENPNEVESLYHDILINVTSFFREPDSFVALKELAFPVICQNKPSDVPIRIWVAGCSTGEEVYSIAICLMEFFDDRPIRHQIKIFATDISEVVISKARIGFYEENLLKEVSPERLSRFFIPVEGGYQIGRLVRDCCVFARQNLTSDPPFSRLDLISCRNMLIYLEPVLQKKIMPVFHYALNPDGFLMLGSSEGIGNATDLFAIIDKKQRIYKRKITPARMNFNFVKSTYETLPVNISKLSESATDSDLEQLADRVVLSRYTPVGVTINEELEILQFRGQTSPYLEQPSGKASLNLLKMARTELRLELRSAIHNAKQHDLPFTKDGIEMSQGVLVKLDVIPLKINSDRYFLVLFESRPKPSAAALALIPQAKSRKVRQTEAELAVVRLTNELESTKKYLRTIVETHESTNQELRVASEEFLSSNEELQSANEELETAKEEVQATNEELSTVNDELRSRNLQLQQSNNDMQNLLSSVNIAILMLSGDLHIRRFTPMAEQVFNLIPTDVGRPFSDIQTNIDGADLLGLASAVIITLIPFEQEVQDRSQHWYSLRIRPYRTIENVIDGVVISLIDIDTIKKNSLELEFSRNYSKAIVETLRQPLLVLDSDLRVITANLAFYQIFQMLPSQTEGQSIYALGQGDWNISQLRSLLNDILAHSISVQDYEITQDFTHLGTRTMLLNASELYQANIGKMIVIAIEDITERKVQKQQLIAQNQELAEAILASEAANLAKCRFLGNMSHEFRTPLNSILGFSQLLKSQTEIAPDIKEFAEIIYQSGEHLFSLIQDLLDISRIESKKIAIEPSLLPLANFLQITVDMISIKAAEKSLNLTTHFAPNLPDNIYADEMRLRQVLLNLLGNAIKFTSTGTVTFSVSKIQSDDGNGNTKELMRFAIADTGVGIAATDIESIFLPFEQVGKRELQFQGAGLGLAISQDLVKKMGGEITVVSEIGVGSTFSFELDLKEPRNY
ncbi:MULTISPECIES: chemotaxis protein CheB [Pseudanabaena]|uniref:chemotaxis protein CheB n=1 Tax=Pseudanabaena TaxID=1152 RepID=UPI00247ABEF0|nr:MULTISPECIES: chemotaxis protein CheB [Pseudanabaena]MEA5487561.1 chemotaxis protein CheB [Pseudanabaena sp. CCNP1317]WGS73967.1 PAS domain-containing protein [Pseudanabaena galeata CCNP1313]